VDTPQLKVKYGQAGWEFLASLQNLGLDPQALFWAYDKVINDFVLVLITDFFDDQGPYEISKLLFRAYNVAATPKLIDPFMVRLHSPHQAFSQAIKERLFSRSFRKLDKTTMQPIGPSTDIKSVNWQGMIVSKDWVYVVRPTQHKRSVESRIRRWSKFKTTVERLAA
jgi:hypothetical protein